LTALFLAALLAALALRLWLSIRQERHVLARRGEVPAPFLGTIPLEAHRKAADYAVARARFSRVADAWQALVLLGLTLGGGLEMLGRLFPAEGIVAGTGYVLAAFLVQGLLLLPLDIHRTFAIERRFGFNRTTPGLFAADLAKGLLVGAAIGAPVIASALGLVRAGLPVAIPALWLAFSLLGAWIFPAIIAPLFNRFRPLADEALAGRIAALLERAGFESGGVFVMDGSRRSTHANAYFTGLGRRKRVVFFDTLLELLTPDEVLAVLAHELGHFRLRHLEQRLAAGTAVAAVAGFLLCWLARQVWFFEGLGVGTPTWHAGLVLFLLVAPVFAFLLGPVVAAASRRHEFQADAFAAAQGGAAPMAGALVKLCKHNAGTLTPDPLYTAFHATHPPVAVRVERLGQTLHSSR
jgi:STE24 endopeptidase